MEFIEKLLENLSVKMGMQDWPELWQGLIFGAILIIVLLILVKFIKWIIRPGKKNRGIMINGDNGDLTITLSAVEEFVRRILVDFHEASLRSLSISERNNLLTFNVVLEVIPDANLIPLRDAVQDRVSNGAKAQLGIECDLRINITVQSMEANEQKIAKADRRKVEKLEEKEMKTPPYQAFENDNNGENEYQQ